MLKRNLILISSIFAITSCSAIGNNLDLISLKDGDLVKYDFLTKNDYNPYVKGYKWVYTYKLDDNSTGQKATYEVLNINQREVELSVTGIESSGKEIKRTFKTPVSSLIAGGERQTTITGMKFKSFEKVTVPFGTFDSLKLNENAPYGSVTAWFVKGIGTVKLEFSNSSSTNTIELESFSK